MTSHEHWPMLHIGTSKLDSAGYDYNGPGLTTHTIDQGSVVLHNSEYKIVSSSTQLNK
ncbi:uncharacterized protein TRIVIDRAFT_185762 [Trichoderma virens Gv29-8]|uniref:Uncharacterized protein n=1 Tax=Hypocrea virens (strain Gv29-8 / FGSC 10586) TaxID=413071 RepID=G9MI96_HYPVG|nr:uncharacterized protein TRIVIDRAFT_185762 [Trichoderma virens Gv29-8]EHK25213.1 hypothetical protein TRIVIDRAFT_185762 [Trichoderma virens Gv29-8]